MRSTKKILMVCLIFFLTVNHAAVFEIGPEDDNLQASVAAMQAGDVLVLRGGLYTLDNRFGITLNCSAQNLCVIKAKPGETPHINRPTANQNIIDLENSQYVIIDGIEFSGGSRGIRITNSNHITIRNSHIHDTGDAAITANDAGSTYSHIKLQQNHIHDTDGTGEGMYLGCNNNMCQFSNGLIANNYIHHTNGPNVSQGDGIEVKEGSYNNRIVDNVIHDTNYPCIITYSTVGNGSANVISGNLMWGCGDHGIQSASDAVITNNIILGAAADGIRSQPQQSGTPSNLVITNNTIINNSAAVRLNDISGTIVLANNALYATSSGVAIRVSGNLTELSVLNNIGEGSLIGVMNGFSAGNIVEDFISADYSNALPQDVFPKTGSALIGAADAPAQASDDFNHVQRGTTLDVGAYKFDAVGNQGWVLNQGFKPSDIIFSDGYEYRL